MKKKVSLERYLIALVPKEPILSDIWEMKKEGCEYFSSCASLNSPPHITLHMPFSMKKEKEELLINFLTDFALECKKFDLQIDGVGSFHDRVVFLSLAENEDIRVLQKTLTKGIRRSLNIFNSDYKNKGFHPHITLVFRDLKKVFFADAIKHFSKKNYHKPFEVLDIALLKYNGEKWNDFKTFTLKEK